MTVKVGLAEFDPDTFESAVGALIAERRPDLVLVAHSVDSFGYAAALAARLELGFATDVFKVERIDGELVATRGCSSTPRRQIQAVSAGRQQWRGSDGIVEESRRGFPWLLQPG